MSVVADTSCAAFRRLPPEALQPNAIHRFVIGEDSELRALSREEAERELADPFATLLLLRGTFPRTAGEVLDALDRVVPEGDPLREGFFFLLGEGSQIPMSAETEAVARNLRFLVTRGQTNDGPDLLLSSFHPDEPNIELMAWDRQAGGFNYYQTVGGSNAWVFAGNSRHALLEPTQGKGPFESHLSGNFVMKELRFPWLHWHSQAANILPSVLPRDPPLTNHPWVTNRNPQSAAICEDAVAKPSIERWTKARFDQLLAGGGVIRDPKRIMLQVLDTPSVNLITSHTESRVAESIGSVDLPQTFFIDSEGLTEAVQLQAPPPFAVSGEIYARSLVTLEVKLSDERGFERTGDTHFAFAVPERAFEDGAVLRRAIKVGLISRRLAACLLMTDFANPIFSARRARLVAFTPDSATVINGGSDFSQQMGDTIAAAAMSTAEESPEREFARRWAAGEDFEPAFNSELDDYYRAITARLATQEGFDDFVRLAESRRDHVRRMPIHESPLLFAHTNIPPATREMRLDGTVAEV